MPLRPVEQAYGLAVGRARGVEALQPGASQSPREALESILTAALARPPCVVSFSGGRDSSGLLAVAAAVARREGLPEPIPATLVFPTAGESDERSWQEMVLSRLGLSDWVRVELSDELDAIGPVAGPMMRRHGLVWPFNLHYHVPLMEVAEGGSLITGFGGDELAHTCSLVAPERLTLAGARHHPRLAVAAVYRWLPRAMRWPRELLRADEGVEFMGVGAWLTAKGRRALEREVARDALLHRGWDHLVRDNFWRQRFVHICRDNFQIVADPYRVRMVHPFVEPALLRALAERGGYRGLAGREEILELLAGDLVPRELITRRSKATFLSTLWTDKARAFAHAWNGQGLGSLVDSAKLRGVWAQGNPPLSTTLLQKLWLTAQER